MSLLCLAGFLAGGAVLVPGCTEDAGQPSRQSISAPRTGGGKLEPGADPKGKGKASPGGKLGAKG
jgi:hypothetical protein